MSNSERAGPAVEVVIYRRVRRVLTAEGEEGVLTRECLAESLADVAEELAALKGMASASSVGELPPTMLALLSAGTAAYRGHGNPEGNKYGRRGKPVEVMLGRVVLPAWKEWSR